MAGSKEQLIDIVYSLEVLKRVMDMDGDEFADHEGTVDFLPMGRNAQLAERLETVQIKFGQGVDVVHVLIFNEGSIDKGRQLATCLRRENIEAREVIFDGVQAKELGIVACISLFRSSSV